MGISLSQYALPLFIALFGLESKSLTIKGAISAILLAYVIILRQSLSWFLILFSFYIMGTLTTKWKEKEKKRHSLIQKTRGPWNVIGNGGAAILMALLGGMVGLIGFISAVATATADTLSSELGISSKSKPRGVTTFRKVEPGTNGGVTAYGTLMGSLGAMVIGLISLLEIDISIVVIGTLAGTIGCFADSYIGAILENRDLIGNSTTNFLATIIGAISGILIYLQLGI